MGVAGQARRVEERDGRLSCLHFAKMGGGLFQQEGGSGFRVRSRYRAVARSHLISQDLQGLLGAECECAVEVGKQTEEGNQSARYQRCTRERTQEINLGHQLVSIFVFMHVHFLRCDTYFFISRFVSIETSCHEVSTLQRSYQNEQRTGFVLADSHCSGGAICCFNEHLS